MSKSLLIYAHNGSVGATSDLENGSFLNDFKADGQMGLVVAVENVSITSKALELMKTNHTRAGGSFSGIMVTRSASESHPNSIGVMGFGLHGIAIGGPTEFSRDCDLTVLDEIEVDDDMTIPADFIAFIDDL